MVYWKFLYKEYDAKVLISMEASGMKTWRTRGLALCYLVSQSNRTYFVTLRVNVLFFFAAHLTFDPSQYIQVNFTDWFWFFSPLSLSIEIWLVFPPLSLSIEFGCFFFNSFFTFH